MVDNPQAIDLGGVTKQFISTLIQALCEKGVIGRNSHLFPIIRDSHDSLHMQRLGQFYSAIFEKNRDRTDKFVTGPLFHPLFFDLVKITLQEDSSENKLKQIAQAICKIDPALEPAKEALIDPDRHLQAYRDIMGAEVNLQEIFIGYVQAAAAFGTGLSEEFRVQLQRADLIFWCCYF